MKHQGTMRPWQRAEMMDSRILLLPIGVMLFLVLGIAVCLFFMSEQGQAQSMEPQRLPAALPTQAVPSPAEDLPSETAATIRLATPQAMPTFATVPACFAGQPDYAYDDAQFSMRIKRITEASYTYFLCDIQTPDPASAIKAGLSGDTLYGGKEHTSDIAARNGAVLAINGDGYSFHQYGTIIRNGQLVRANKTTRHMLTLDAQGNLATVTQRRGEDPKALGDQLLAEGVTQTWEFGPALVQDGQAAALDETFDLLSLRENALEPRTAIGQIGEGHYFIIVVDGRRTGYSDGVSLWTLQSLCLQAGAQTAFNLDGGGSTTLYFDGAVINRPSGGSERSVSDIVYF